MNNALTGSSIVGIILLIWGGLRLWRNKPIKTTTWMWVGAGFTLAGSIVAGLQGLIREAAKTAGAPVGLAANVVVGVIGCALMWVVWDHVPLRKGRGAGGTSGSSDGKKFIPILGLIAPMLLLTSTGLLGDWAHGIGNMLGRLGGPLATFFGA